AAPGAKPASPRPAAASDRPADKAAGRTPEPSAGQTPAKPASPSPVQTQARLEFDYPIDRESLGALFSDALQARYGTRTVEFVFQKLEPRKPEFQDASPVRSDTWDVRVQLPEAEARPIFDEVKRLLEQSPFFPSSDTIGGEVARQTRQRAVWALLASTLFILLYIWVRFQRITYGLGAVVSIVHDILMALSFVAISKYLAEYFGFSLLGVEPFKINVIMMTAFLTIAGYSLNDTIVIFDRIREVRGKAPQVTQEMINTSINQTLGRTLLTGVTSIWVILTLYLFGGPTIHGFAYAMLIGVITGTYSSIYIAAPFLLWVSRRAEAR
ncbi:MAG: protein translocase subunit SecF, partial [Thermoguttaceae bacterium]